MTQPVELALVGAGLRGALSYGPVALRHPDELRFVEVVERNPVRLERFARAHGITPDRQFASVDEWLAAPRRAQAAVIATPDDQHAGPAIGALGAGLDVLVEKPLAPTASECVDMVAAADASGRRLEVCHVLRYTAFFRALHQVVAEEIGDVVTFEHRENVAWWHMAHSYVRGAYADTSRAAPFLLAKCCHDLDLVRWNMGALPVTVSSTGSLLHFRADRAPVGSAARCTDTCPLEATCDYSAVTIYLGRRKDGGSDRGRDGGSDGGKDEREGEWVPVTPFAWMPLTDHGEWDRGGLTETAEERLAALRAGPYGRCVYRCDNDALDNQLALMEFASGATGVLAVHGHSHDDQRTLRYDGTRATVRGRFGDFSGEELVLHRHGGRSPQPIPLDTVPGMHGGGDVGVIRSFAATLRGEAGTTTAAAEALGSHLLGFAAEQARRTGTVVDVAAYRASVPGATPAT